MNINTYGHDKSRQNYLLSDGSTAPMDIVVNNNLINILLGGRYYLRKGKVEPYVAGKVGYAVFSTDLSIFDPDDRDHCEPIDTELLQRDGLIVFGAGAGLRVDVSPGKNPGRFYINASANYLTGGKASYMSVDAPDMAHQGTRPTSDVYVKFLNTQTQVVHEHHVGNIYTSMVHLIDFRLGLTVKLSY
jgi:hypothetical protein